jgi:hypothetical protein
MSDTPEPLRPRDFALLRLASGDLAPRQRARDQQADRAGLALQRRLLEGIAARDPEPEELEATLLALADELGPPPGPALAVARVLLEDWRTAQVTPEWVALLLGDAVRGPGRRTGNAAGSNQENPPNG